MNLMPCPYGEQDLLPLALGEPASAAVQCHVVGCTTCQDRVQRLQRESAALRKAALDPYATVSERDSTARPAEPGEVRTIGKYMVVGQLGAGAQAAAYRAVHPNLPRELAIKLSHRPIRAGSAAHDLLVREGRHLAQLDHPNIARVFDLDFHEGRPFLVMEYHRGVNLQQFAKGRQLPPHAAARLLIPLARAADAAHRQGIVHQDIKPANILVTESGKPYLLDFGLAQFADAWSGADEQPVGGTAAYMAPEQARGDANATPAGDTFALGAVLYFLLTGTAPFHGRDSREAMEHAAQCDFDRAALRRPGIPRRLAAICLRAMSADPAHRYTCADQLAADIERYLRRSRQFLAMTVTMVLVCLLLGVWYFWPQADAAPPPLQPLIATLGRMDEGKPLLLKPDTPERLAGLAPLRPGDNLELSCDVPRGYPATFFLLDTTGALRELAPLHTSRAGLFDRVRFPADGVWQVEKPHGTVLFLVCANRRGRPSVEDVRPLLEEEGPSPLPVPAEPFLLLLGRDNVEPFGDVPRPVAHTPYSQLRSRLERLREAGAARFDYIWGAALPVNR